MTPKEKAEELVMSFLSIKSYGADKSGWAGMDAKMAKKCAIVAVNEIIPICTQSRFYDFWSDVKEEIEKL